MWPLDLQDAGTRIGNCDVEPLTECRQPRLKRAIGLHIPKSVVRQMKQHAVNENTASRRAGNGIAATINFESANSTREDFLHERHCVRGRGLALTAQADAGRKDLGDAFELVAKAVESMRLKDGRQRLIVSVEPSFAMAWLVPRLQSFRKKHADIDVLIDSSFQIVDLERGAADIAVRFGSQPSSNLKFIRLFDEELRAFCNPRLASGPPSLQQIENIQHSTLLHWDLTHFENASATRQWVGWPPWLHQLGNSRVVPKENVYFSDYNLALQAAIAGQGLILGSAPVLRNFVEAGLLTDPFRQYVKTDLGYDLVTAQKTALRPEIAQFIDWIVGEAKAQNAGG
jgi:LysR family transcriptional regulator, glycine cleavage system transcriptional activator